MRAGYVDCAFGQIHYRARPGTDAARPTILLLNPRSRSWDGLISLLDRERRVLIVDIPGYGASSPPAVPCSMKDIAAAVANLMDNLEVRVAHACGFHTGGKVAAALAANWPSRFTSVIICGKSHSLIPDQLRRNKAMRDQVAKRKPDVVLVGMESFVAGDAAGPAGVAHVYEANFRFDLAAAVSQFECPLLVVEITCEEEDAAHGRQADQLALLARDGRSITLAERETMGIDLYVGADLIAPVLENFMSSSEGFAFGSPYNSA